MKRFFALTILLVSLIGVNAAAQLGSGGGLVPSPLAPTNQPTLLGETLTYSGTNDVYYWAMPNQAAVTTVSNLFRTLFLPLLGNGASSSNAASLHATNITAVGNFFLGSSNLLTIIADNLSTDTTNTAAYIIGITDPRDATNSQLYVEAIAATQDTDTTNTASYIIGITDPRDATNSQLYVEAIAATQDTDTTNTASYIIAIMDPRDATNSQLYVEAIAATQDTDTTNTASYVKTIALPLAGGTMAGNIALDGNDITGAGNITVSTEFIGPILRAASVAGLRLEDDGNVLGVFVEDGTGDVAIRHNNPEQSLHVKDSTALIQIEDSAGGAHGFILKDTNQQWNITSPSLTDDIRINDVSGGGGNMVTFERGGQVGIGTTTPHNDLHVAGGITAQSITNTGSYIGTYSGAQTTPTWAHKVSSYSGEWSWQVQSSDGQKLVGVLGTAGPVEFYLFKDSNAQMMYVSDSGGWYKPSAQGFTYGGTLRSTYTLESVGTFGVSSSDNDVDNGDRLAVTASGVGIGTNAPDVGLHYVGNQQYVAVRFENRGTVADRNIVFDLEENSSDGDAMFRFSDDGTVKWAMGRQDSDDSFIISSAGLLSDPHLQITTGGHIKFIGLGNYGVQADATTAGVPTNGIYHTNGVLKIVY